MPEGATGSTQVDLRKFLAASLSQETKRIIEGLMDGSIELTVLEALEIVRNHIYQPPVKEYLTALTLRFQQVPYVMMRDYDAKGKPVIVKVPIDIKDSEIYRTELVKNLVMQSTIVWTEVFHDAISFTAAASINRQREDRRRRTTTLEDLL